MTLIPGRGRFKNHRRADREQHQLQPKNEASHEISWYCGGSRSKGQPIFLTFSSWKNILSFQCGFLKCCFTKAHRSIPGMEAHTVLECPNFILLDNILPNLKSIFKFDLPFSTMKNENAHIIIVLHSYLMCWVQFAIFYRFSQEKFVRKKSKKYFPYIVIRKPTVRLIAQGPMLQNILVVIFVLAS